jgi:RNA polymerase sigma-70 factor (ECF subfamily)
VNSALQRARATLASRDVGKGTAQMSESQTRLVDRYVDAFQRYDVDELASLLREDATFCMPPYRMWLCGPEPVRAWLLGPGAACRGSKLIPVGACASPAFAQYRRNPEGGYKAWALVILELSEDRIAGWNAFLDVETMFPRFDLPAELPG